MSYKLFSFCLFLLMSIECFTQPQIECKGEPVNGVSTLMIWNLDKGSKYQITEAQKDALCFVIYNGLELGGNCSSQKTLLTHEDEIVKFKQIQATFFAENGDWSRFIQVITSDAKPTMAQIKRNCKVYSFRLSRNELKSYLESKDVIKNLKTGF